jgi:hypothetical protein
MRRLHGRQGAIGRRTHEDVYRELDRLDRERPLPLRRPVRTAPLDDDGMALHVAQLAQPLGEGLGAAGRGRTRTEKADPRHLR